MFGEQRPAHKLRMPRAGGHYWRSIPTPEPSRRMGRCSRSSFVSVRCLIPANCYYEWKKNKPYCLEATSTRGARLRSGHAARARRRRGPRTAGTYGADGVIEVRLGECDVVRK